MSFEKIAPYLSNHPLVLIGFALLILLGFLRKALKQASRTKGDTIVRYGFVAAVIVILLGFAIEWRARASAESAVRTSFDLTVRAEAPGAPIIMAGSVVVDFGNDRRTSPFGKTGDADFKSIPYAFMGMTVKVIALVPGYVQKTYQVTISSSVMNLTLEPLPPVQEPPAAADGSPRERRPRNPPPPPVSATASAPPPGKETAKPAPSPENPALEITAADEVSDWTVGAPATQVFHASGGKPPYVWAQVGPIISGLSFRPDERDSTTAAIAGAPTAPGSVSMTLRLNDSTGAGTSRAYTLQSVSPLKIALTEKQAEAMLGVGFSRELTAAGGIPPYSWSGERLPAWLAIESKLGVLRGAPTQAKTDSFRLIVIDAAGRRDQADFTITAFRGIRIFVESGYRAPGDLTGLLNQVKAGCLARAPFAIEPNREQADAILIPADYGPEKNHIQLLLNSRTGHLLWGNTMNRDLVDGRWVLSPDDAAAQLCGGRAGLVRHADEIMNRL